MDLKVDKAMKSRSFVLTLLLVTVFFTSGFSQNSWAESILIIGDSLTCGPFGAKLFQNLEQDAQGKKNKVTLFCAVSSAPRNWLEGKKPANQICQTKSTSSPELRPCPGKGAVPRLEKILEENKVDHIIIGLGTNSLGSPKADSSYSQMAKMVGEKSKRCEWIGPPHLNPPQAKGFKISNLTAMEKNLSPFYESLKEKVQSSCPLIDSRQATVAGSGGEQTVDGVHRNRASGEHWADAIKTNLTQSMKKSYSGQSGAKIDGPAVQ